MLLFCLQVPEEKAHSVWLAAGSGLRSDVWKDFVRRFGSIKIREGYGLTEASIGFLNYTDEVGPIGRASYFNKVRTTKFEYALCYSRHFVGVFGISIQSFRLLQSYWNFFL